MASARKLSDTNIFIIYLRPVLEHASPAWSNITLTQRDRLERVQRRAVKIILGIPLFAPHDHTDLLSRASLAMLESRRHLHQVILAYKLKNNICPPHLLSIAPPLCHPSALLRHQRTFRLPTPRTSAHLNSPVHLACQLFNDLPSSIRNEKSLASFRKAAASHLLSHTCHCSQHRTTPHKLLLYT